MAEALETELTLDEAEEELVVVDADWAADGLVVCRVTSRACRALLRLEKAVAGEGGWGRTGGGVETLVELAEAELVVEAEDAPDAEEIAAADVADEAEDAA